MCMGSVLCILLHVYYVCINRFQIVLLTETVISHIDSSESVLLMCAFKLYFFMLVDHTDFSIFWQLNMVLCIGVVRYGPTFFSITIVVV
jgi:hypothetical protein